MTIYPWQQEAWDKIINAYNSGRLPHALLLHGPKDCGKLDFAQSLTAKLSCEDKQVDFACGKCKYCNLLKAGSHPDFKLLRVEDDEIIKVDAIRKIEETLKLTPRFKNMKISIIYPAENMNINAANSLLKTLEEPASNTLIILVSHAPQKLLPTIRSRCQSIFIPKPSLAEAKYWLADYSLKTDIRLLLEIAGGSPLLALELDATEQVQVYLEFLDDCYQLKLGQADPLRISLKWSKDSFSRTIMWLMLLTSKIIKNAMRPEADLSDKNLEFFYKKPVELRMLFAFYEQLLKAQSMLKSSVNQRLELDNLLLSWQKL